MNKKSPIKGTERLNWKLEFANVWEDTEIDLAVLEPKAGARIFCIASGGCTALAFLSKGATVTAVDVNPAQNALLELKLSAAQVLGYQAWRRFLGLEKGGDRLSSYAKVHRYLSGPAKLFWDKHLPMVDGGIVDQGAVERLLTTCRRIYHRLVHSPASCAHWFNLHDIEAQQQYYRDIWDTRLRRTFLRIILNPILFRWYSSTANQYAYIHRADIANALLSRLEYAMTSIPTSTNYFLSRLLLGRFLNGPLGEPYYLRSEAHEMLSSSRSRLILYTDDLIRILEQIPFQKYDGFALSNVVDWLPEAAQERLFKAVVRTAAPGARICLRSVQHSWRPPKPVESVLHTDPVRSAALLKRDRSFVYGTMYAANVQP
ncbi:MAG TPA: DUF3419 family protein [Candidatus Manganitrophaceae bacterium]|nr:DUF3419 family protein [Candidatus Manganitrophaceae bacterium]